MNHPIHWAAPLTLLAALRQRATPLAELDARALADIGVQRSEIESIEGQARGLRDDVTRRRIDVYAGA